MIIAFVLLAVMALGGAVFAFSGGNERSQKRVAAVARPSAQLRGGRDQADIVAKRAKNLAAQLKDIEKNQARKKEKPTMRRRLEQAGFPNTTARTYWIICAVLGVAAAFGCYHHPPDAAGHRAWPLLPWASAFRAGRSAFSPTAGARNSRPNSPMRLT